MGKNVIISTLPNISQNYLPKVNTSNIFANSLVYDDGSSVLINTTTASAYKLDVNGTGRFQGALTGTSATFSSSVTAGQGLFTSSSFPLDLTANTNNYGIRLTSVQAPTLLLYSTFNNANNRNWGIYTNYAVFGDFAIAQSNAKDGDLTTGANGTARLYIKNDGNVGIGTTSPDVTGFGYTTLTIKGGTTAGYAGVLELQTTQTTTNGQNVGIIAFLDGTSRNAQIGVQRDTSTSTSNMMFYTNAGSGIVERMRIDSVGRLVFNPASINDLNNSIFANSNGYFYHEGGTNGLILSNNSVQDCRIRIEDANTMQFETSSTERMRITSGGDVGIGLTSPVVKLDVNGSVYSRGNLGAANGTQSTNTTSAVLYLGNRGYFTSADTGAAQIQAISSSPNWYSGTSLAFFTNPGPDVTATSPVERMRITSGGNVGIGISNPSYLLHIPQNNNLFLGNIYISGSANNPNLGSGATGGSLTLAGGGVGEGKIYIQGAASGGNGYIEFYTNNALRMTIASNGNIGAPSGTNIYNASDLRLKRNISTLSDGLDKILNLNPVKFNWIEGFEPTEEDKDMFGFIAQEIQTVIPEAVETFASGDLIKVDDAVIDNPLRVNEKFIIPVLVKAIQEQQAQIEEQKADIESLKALINK